MFVIFQLNAISVRSANWHITTIYSKDSKSVEINVQWKLHVSEYNCIANMLNIKLQLKLKSSCSMATYEFS